MTNQSLACRMRAGLIDLDDPFLDLNAEGDPARTTAAVIAHMAAFTTDLHLTAEMRAYCNPYAPGAAYPALVLTEFFAERPGEGAGTTWLNEVFRLCDALDLALYTDADGPGSRDFYLSRGFELTTGRRDHQLVRWSAPSLEAMQSLMEDEPQP